MSRREYGHLLVELVGLKNESTALRHVETLARTHGNGEVDLQEPTKRVRAAPQQKAEWEMLKLLVQSRDVYESQGPNLREEHFDRASHRRLFALLQVAGGDVRRLVAESDDDRVAASLAALATERVEGEPTPLYADRVRLSLEEYLLKRRIDALRKRLERLNPIKDPDYEPLYEELVGLEGIRRRVRAQADPD